MRSSGGRTALVCAAAALGISAGVAKAAEPSGRFALGAQIGSAGPGVEAEVRLTDILVIRGALGGFGLSRHVRSGGVDYRGRARWLTDSGIVDIHPLANSLLVSAGAYYGRRRIDLSATPNTPVGGSGTVLTPTQLGRIEGRAKLSGFAPFVGVGWDSSFHGRSPWGLKARLGLIFSRTPSVHLASPSPSAADPLVQAYLRQQEASVRDRLHGLKTYPLLEIGLDRRF